MFELRRLRLGDRPVTGQGHKEAVEEFFTSSQSNEPAPTAEHRPEAVVVEVQGLVERRPVSSVLGSTRLVEIDALNYIINNLQRTLDLK